eukprot:m.18667 g.18667  ORF g.18667 m.18667 type:complete len:424 (+) comp7419_c1_seq1:58-1329(+)
MRSPPQTTRVFKKTSPNEAVTVYLGKRDFYDHGDHVDPIDGVVAVNRDLVGSKKVFVRFSAVFNYTAGESDALGIGVRKELYSSTVCVYPSPYAPPPLTRLQKKLYAKIGENAHGFIFQLPSGVPSSVTLQSLQAAANPKQHRCGVDHELVAFVADVETDRVSKKASVRLNVRKLSYLRPELHPVLPSASSSKSFLLGSGQLGLTATLNKELYYHGEPVEITVAIDNHSSRSVKSILLKVRQFTQLRTEASGSDFSSKCIIAQIESTVGCPIASNSSVEHKYSLVPSRQDNLKQLHLALDGQLKDEDTALASSTMMSGRADPVGIIVSYEVKVALIVALASDVVVKVPFSLSAPPPALPEPETPRALAGPASPAAAASDKASVLNFDEDEDLEFEFVEFMRGRVEKFYTDVDADHDDDDKQVA